MSTPDPAACAALRQMAVPLVPASNRDRERDEAELNGSMDRGEGMS